MGYSSRCNEIVDIIHTNFYFIKDVKNLNVPNVLYVDPNTDMTQSDRNYLRQKQAHHTMHTAAFFLWNLSPRKCQTPASEYK